MTTITLAIRLADADRALLARAVAALELLVTPDAPALAPAGLILVPRGAPVEFTMDRDLPLGKDGILEFRPNDYDGPIALKSVDGAGTVTSEDAAGDKWRVAHADDAAEGQTITAVFEADRRHGAGVDLSDDTVTITIVAADADPLQEADFAVVDKGQPAPPPAA